MMKFIPGLQLSQLTFTEIIQPMMQVDFPQVQYSAARLDWGSDVLGFDTPMSMDHGWGPRLQIFLDERDYLVLQEKLDHHFADHLPFEVHGFPMNFGEPYSEGGVMSFKETYPIHHGISITTPDHFLSDYLGVDISQRISPEVWLTLPQQKLRTIRSGKIYYDGLKSLNKIRQLLHWYPHDLWLYLMANQWQRIDQKEPFMGRTGDVGDELGSKLIAARLIHNLMNLAFLMEKEYAPYSKWFGTAFKQLAIAPELLPIFSSILESRDWQTRETFLSQAYKVLADVHNDLKLTPFIEPGITDFHKRPFRVLHSSRFVEALLAVIKDPGIRSLPPHLGSINQIVDNTDVLESNSRCKKMRVLYSNNVENNPEN